MANLVTLEVITRDHVILHLLLMYFMVVDCLELIAKAPSSTLVAFLSIPT